MGSDYKRIPVINLFADPGGLGEAVFSVGFPNVGIQGFSPKLSKGEIAGLTGIQDNPRDFQVSVPLQPGNSGGALVDERGNVVVVVVAKLSSAAMLKATRSLPENGNYAAKSSYLLSFLESVPDAAANLPDANVSEAVNRAQSAAVLVLGY